VVWTREIILDRIREWNECYGEPPACPDWDPWKARHVLHDEDRALRFEAAGDYWPWFTKVVKVFGSWNAAIVEAGFRPRVNHGGGGNRMRRRVVA
jgi:hypothetical protein